VAAIRERGLADKATAGGFGWLSRRHSAGLLQQENHSRRRCRFQPTQAMLRFIVQ
jgi:hypothetical protein